MSIDSIVAVYGYPAIVVGTFFEGETILVLAGFAAHRGYLQLPWVLVWGFLGTLCGDQLYFQIGRAKGMKFLERRPHWSLASRRVVGLLQRHQNLLILGFRFLYGLRTVTPFLLGASGTTSARFFVLNGLGSLAWTICIGVLGYLFGQVVEVLIGDIRRYELLLFVTLALIGSTVWCIHGLKRRRMPKQIARPKE